MLSLNLIALPLIFCQIKVFIQTEIKEKNLFVKVLHYAMKRIGY